MLLNISMHKTRCIQHITEIHNDQRLPYPNMPLKVPYSF